MEVPQAATENHKIIKESSQKIRNELLDVPTKTPLFFDILIIFVSSLVIWATCGPFIRGGITEESVNTTIVYLLVLGCAIVATLFALFDSAITIFLRIVSLTGARCSLAYGVLQSSATIISLSATCSAL